MSLLPQTKANSTMVRISSSKLPVNIASGVWIWKVPTNIYQMFADMITQGIWAKHQMEEVRENDKHRILEELKNIVSDKFPGFVVTDIADYNKKEAQQIHPLLEWGMYVQLAQGKYVEGTIASLQASLKQLTYE